MKRRAMAARTGLAIGAIAWTLASSAAAEPRFDPTHADEQVEQARSDGLDAFCKEPKWPLSARARTFCDEAPSIPKCEGLVKACGLDVKPPAPPSWLHFLAFLAPLARIAVYGAIAAVLGAAVWLLVSAILRAKRDRVVADAPESKRAVAVDSPRVEELAVTHDAETLLRRAEGHAAQGELDRAAVLYLAASLRALDRRGAIRIARDRTNGEYVRTCGDPEAKTSLRAIVREVDRVQYGGEQPTREAIAEVAARATGLVRAVAAALVVIACVAGCDGGPPKAATDPAGDDLLFALLSKQGANVTRLPTSIATLPLPKEDEPAPVVVVDVDRVPLEDEARAHLRGWVEAGGCSSRGKPGRLARGARREVAGLGRARREARGADAPRRQRGSGPGPRRRR